MDELKTKFDYSASHAAPRMGAMDDVESYESLIKLINRPNDIPLMERALFSCCLFSGARISEILNAPQSAFKFYKHDSKIPVDQVATRNYKDIANIDLERFDLTLEILKRNRKPKTTDPIKLDKWNNKKKKRPQKTIPCIRSIQFMDLFDTILEYIRTLPVEPDSLVFPGVSRYMAWWRVKRYIGKGYWNHYWRHASTSNDIRSGVNVLMEQKKLGHKSLGSMENYLHFAIDDIKNDLVRVYGQALEKIPSPGPPTEVKIMAAQIAASQVDTKVVNDKGKKDAIIMIPKYDPQTDVTTYETRNVPINKQVKQLAKSYADIPGVKENKEKMEAKYEKFTGAQRRLKAELEAERKAEMERNEAIQKYQRAIQIQRNKDQQEKKERERKAFLTPVVSIEEIIEERKRQADIERINKIVPVVKNNIFKYELPKKKEEDILMVV